MPNDDRWMTTRDASEYLSISENSITRHCRSGRLRHRRTPGIKGVYRFRREWLDDFLQPPRPSPMLKLPPIRLPGFYPDLE